MATSCGSPVQNPANIVAAIDFGTTSCSLAYSGIDGTVEDLDINVFKKRVLTAILLRKEAKNECSVGRFGIVAQETAAVLSPSAYNNYHYFEFFKMHLHQEVRKIER